MERYGASSLQTAVDSAADIERGNITGDFVAVWRLVESRGIDVVSRAGGLAGRHPHARLVPSGSRFIIELREGLTPLRQRFSLGHELGHMLFYRNDARTGFRHSIGVLDADEINSEEHLCNQFSRALLIPQLAIARQDWSAPDDPSFVLSALVAAAARFGVSIPVLIDRIVDLEVPMSACLVLHMRYVENRVTRSEPALRVVKSYSLGGAANRLYIWRNRSASGIGVESVTRLFESWRLRAALDGMPERDTGCYLWSHSRGLRCGAPASAERKAERVAVSTYDGEAGSWARASVPVWTASCLFARKRAYERQAHVLSVLIPTAN